MPGIEVITLSGANGKIRVFKDGQIIDSTQEDEVKEYSNLESLAA